MRQICGNYRKIMEFFLKVFNSNKHFFRIFPSNRVRFRKQIHFTRSGEQLIRRLIPHSQTWCIKSRLIETRGMSLEPLHSCDRSFFVVRTPSRVQLLFNWLLVLFRFQFDAHEIAGSVSPSTRLIEREHKANCIVIREFRTAMFY